MGTQKFQQIEQRRYADVRSLIRPGDLFLASGNYPVSRIIEHFSDSIFSHVGIIFFWKSRILLLESVEDDGVRAVPLSHYLNDYENSGEPYSGRLFLARYDQAFSESQLDLMMGNATDRLNRRYDKNEIGRILARITLGLGKHRDDDAYICSEFVDVCFRDIGVRFQPNRHGFLFPENIAADEKVRPLFELLS
ncbi:YiiX/YebB-like N1pC/P60 family cysteine hydrolase [Chitinimonas lacunae]|uniref:YiiX/YebB-like N1pC/P60 family cysteine hydrolase n=1 Tax=Chitinimonas lacunae TaxID=1963018 RepID=A0ABV8MP36_9NEIS